MFSKTSRSYSEAMADKAFSKLAPLLLKINSNKKCAVADNSCDESEIWKWMNATLSMTCYNNFQIT